MTEERHDETVSATDSAVATHLQCVGCGFDVHGLPIEGVCSECQRPVRETVKRPMLRDDQWRCRAAMRGAQIVLTCASLVLLSMATLAALLACSALAPKALAQVPSSAGCAMLLLVLIASVATWLLMSAANWRWRVRLMWLGATVALPFGLLFLGAVASASGLFGRSDLAEQLFGLPIVGVVTSVIPLTRAALAASMATDSFATQQTARLVRSLAVPWAMAAVAAIGGSALLGNLMKLGHASPSVSMLLVARYAMLAFLAASTAYLIIVAIFMHRLARAAAHERRLGTTILP